ncbi:hypothetical protein JOD29_000782 [Lysinibacillus composti]|uniref:Uncharacterized protein n=1 Tax=Lysinibacillus composti TaxID=720633 RepID=A0A3N9UIX8_9BACI|nr:hypothetical protein [Lysinibacillus composti]MBM7607538.1 hypothetical protein [Lysinibacillus composti]RQW75954.1 hypothetical protein EBB45_04880 [Lysinibacillus composti]
MKEIIYLDTEIMNSMLAQLDQGLVNNFSMESSNQETTGEATQSTRHSSGGLTAGVKVSSGFLPGGSFQLGGKSDAGGNESESYTTTFLEGQKDILNKAFHDHALNILISKLEDNELLIRGTNVNEGDLFLLDSQFKFYDFELMKKSLSADFFEKFMLFGISPENKMSIEEAKRITGKKNHNAQERQKLDEARKIVTAHQIISPIINVFDQLNSLGHFASELLTDLSLIKADKNIGLLKKDCLRESAESLSFRTDNSRNAKMLLRVIGKKNNIFDGNSVMKFAENDIDMFPNIMLDIILGSFKILEKNDVLVTPIAIYYE